MKLTDWCTSERPRERLLARGAGGLSDAELVALCLGSGGAGENAVALARRLLAEYGSLGALLHASPHRLLRSRGLGMARVARLKAVVELQTRQAESKLTARLSFTDVSGAVSFVRQQIGYREREVFGCLYLDSRHRLLRWEALFLGSVNRAHVHAREVLRKGMELNAAAAVLAHNHLSGIAEPSQADIGLTHELKTLLAHVDIHLLDHIIVAGPAWVSFAARGLLD